MFWQISTTHLFHFIHMCQVTALHCRQQKVKACSRHLNVTGLNCSSQTPVQFTCCEQTFRHLTFSTNNPAMCFVVFCNLATCSSTNTQRYANIKQSAVAAQSLPSHNRGILSLILGASALWNMSGVIQSC